LTQIFLKIDVSTKLDSIISRNNKYTQDLKTILTALATEVEDSNTKEPVMIEIEKVIRPPIYIYFF
jgi:hypothetical protein